MKNQKISFMLVLVMVLSLIVGSISVFAEEGETTPVVSTEVDTVEDKVEETVEEKPTSMTFDSLVDAIEAGSITMVVYDTVTGEGYAKYTDGSIVQVEDINQNRVMMNMFSDKITYNEIASQNTGTPTTIPVATEDVVTEVKEPTAKDAIVAQLVFIFVMASLLYVVAMTFLKKSKEKDSGNGPTVINSGGNTQTYRGKSNSNTGVKSGVPTVTFDDVQGCDELKRDVQNIITYIQNPQRLYDMGAKAPSGLILYGPPGTGKTLTAKAIAGTAGVNFISASGSDFIEMYVGVGAKRVRKLYEEARKKAPCIVFIDEFDAVGTQRNAGGGGNSEKNQTINALLTELDGFNGSEGILTIVATNMVETLDKALIRPGRFDRQIAVPLPKREDRVKILQLHTRKKPLAKTVNFDVLAGKSTGFSGADLEGWMNESALVALGKGKKIIDMEDVDDAYFKIIMKGDKVTSQKGRSKSELELVAWHEGGHTVAAKLINKQEVSSVTIINSTSGAGGVTFTTPKDLPFMTRDDIINEVKVYYAGRAGEYVLFGEDESKITTGASGDIKAATNYIKNYLGKYGMGDTGMINLEAFPPEVVAEMIFEEASKMAKDIYKETCEFMVKHKAELKAISEALLEKETLTELEICDILGIESVTITTFNPEDEIAEEGTVTA